MGHLLTLCAASDATLAAGTLVGILMIGVVFFGLWIWSLIHCVTNKQLSDNTRIIGSPAAPPPEPPPPVEGRLLLYIGCC